MFSEVNIALIDIECTCEAEPDENFQPEIIEVGVVAGVLSDSEFQVSDQLQLFVRPVLNPQLSAFCISLTGIQQCTVDEALPLACALPVLTRWLSKNEIEAWASWGRFDDKQFKAECKHKLLDNPLENIFHCNVKQVFARKFNHRVGLGRAVQLRGLSFIGRQHSGIDDAKNIVQLLTSEEILRRGILNKYEAGSI